jgi:hypothetical protein
MKHFGFLAVSALLVGIAQATPLVEEEDMFISQQIGAVTVAAFCPRYVLIPNAGETIGDRMGIGENIRAAILAAYAQTLEEKPPFDRTKLIPEVTRRVNLVMRTLEQRRKENTLCDLGPAYARRGWLK